MKMNVFLLLLAGSPVALAGIAKESIVAIDRVGATLKNVRTIMSTSFNQSSLEKMATVQEQHRRTEEEASPEVDDEVLLLKTRCFTECIEQKMTPEQCEAYIEEQINAAGGHEVGDVTIKIQVPRSPDVMKDSYWMVEVPVNIRGQMTCDRNDARTDYPFSWDIDGSSSVPVQDINCERMSAGECCLAIRDYGKTLTKSGGYDVNGNCLACFVHQEALIPVVEDGATKYIDYHEFNNGVCAKEMHFGYEVDALDAITAGKIASAATALTDFQSSPTCKDFDPLLEILYDASAVLAPLSQKVGEFACNFCYGSNDKNLDDPMFAQLVAAMLKILAKDVASSKENCIIIYTDDDGKIVDDPKLGGSRADEPFETEDCEDDAEAGPPGVSPTKDPNDPSNADTCIKDPSICHYKDQFCSFSEVKGYYCRDYVDVGDQCGGLTIPGQENRCRPLEAFCNEGADYCYSNIADAPGTCIEFGEGGFCYWVDDAECLSQDYCDVKAERCKPRLALDECCNPEYDSCKKGLACVEVPVFSRTAHVCRPECEDDKDCNDDEFCTPSGGPDGAPRFCKPYASEGESCEFFAAGPQFVERCNPATHYCRDTRYCYLADAGGTCTALGGTCESDDDCNFFVCLGTGCPPAPPPSFCDKSIGRCKPQYNAGDCCENFDCESKDECNDSMCISGTSCRVAANDSDGPFPEVPLCRKDKKDPICTFEDASACGPNQYCNFSEVRGYECKDYAAPGDPCGGFTIPGEDSRCNPKLAFCADANQCTSFIADAPGKCVLFGENMCDKGMEDNCAKDEWCDVALKKCKPNVGEGECCIPDLNNCGVGEELGSLVCISEKFDSELGIHLPLCVPKCKTDEDCDNSEWCTSGGLEYDDGLSFCKPYQETGGSCLFYAAGPGYQEQCNPETHYCWFTEDCKIPDIGGICELYRNPCKSDADCDDAPATEWCDVSIGYCKPRAEEGDCCYDTEVNSSNAPCIEGTTCALDKYGIFQECVIDGSGEPDECTFEDDTACGPNQYCNFSETRGFECKDYVGVGDSCGGFTLFGEDSRCNPDDAFCYDGTTCFSLIADAPGRCRAYGDGGYCDTVDDPACQDLDEWCDLDENRCKNKLPIGECCDEKIQNCDREEDLTCVPLYFSGISEPQTTCRLICNDDEDCDDGEWCTGEFCKPYASTGEACDFFAAGPSFFERCNPDTHYCRSTQSCLIPDLGGVCELQLTPCEDEFDCPNPTAQWCDMTVGFCKEKYQLNECCDLDSGIMCGAGTTCSTGERPTRSLLRNGNVSSHWHSSDPKTKETKRSLTDLGNFIGTSLCRDDGSGGGVDVAPNCMEDGAQYTCGGFVGQQCPCICGDSAEEDEASGLEVVCVDDPSDECDPFLGGADCIGICTCEKPKEFCNDLRPSQQCGGFAGFECTCDCEYGTEPICVDDPSDNCDPLKGGSDCIGICQCEKPKEVCSELYPAEQCGGFAGFECTCECENGKEPLCVDDPSDDCDPLKGGADCIGLCECGEIPV